MRKRVRIATQQQHSPQTMSGATCTGASRPAATPVAWFHPPKTGTTFANTLIRFANTSAVTMGAAFNISARPDLLFKSRLAPECYKGTLTHRVDGRWEFHGLVGGHGSITYTDFQRFRGHFFGFFRHPQRWARSYYAHHAAELKGVVSFARFRNMTRGLVTNMLTGQIWDGGAMHLCALMPLPRLPPADWKRRIDSIGRNWSKHLVRQVVEQPTLPSLCQGQLARPDTTLALRRLASFAFVGMTDDWVRSICLFHRKFGGRCSAAELQKVRKGKYSLMPNETAAAGKEDALDPFDSAVYAAAAERFAKECKEHGVNERQCAAIGCELGPSGSGGAVARN